MAKKINKEDLDNSVKLYGQYFSEIMQEYEDLYNKSKKYLETSEQNIDTLSKLPIGTKGAQHYLNEHLTNASSLISQCQSLADSKYRVKKSIVDYALKDLSGDDDENEQGLLEAMNSVIEEERKKQIAKDKAITKLLEDNEDIDAKIDEILKSSNQ